MDQTNIYIIGTGAIGIALAVFLKSKGRPVTLIRGSVDKIPDEEKYFTVNAQGWNTLTQKIKVSTFHRLNSLDGLGPHYFEGIRQCIDR